MSGLMSTSWLGPAMLVSMVKSVSPAGGRSVCSWRTMTAMGGISAGSRRPKAATASGSPSTSMRTPSGVLRTNPVRFSSRASR